MNTPREEGCVADFTGAATRQQKDRPTNRTVLHMLQVALDSLKHMLKVSPPQPIISGRCQEHYMACFGKRKRWNQDRVATGPA